MNANADVTYELWHFNVQGWLDQYDEVGIHPHIFSSLQGYPGKWAYSLPGGINIPLDELLRCMDPTFGNVCDYDSMIQSLYEICQKKSKTMEEYMLTVHEAVAVETGPTMRWVGPETLMNMKLEGCGLPALADSGNQVNMMTPEFVQVQGYLVLPLDKLVDYPLHLVGLGSQCTYFLGFVIARLQVKEVAGYDEDVVFLVVPDESSFSRRVPLVIGTCTLEHIINVIKESELEWISTPWAMVCLAHLLSQCVVADESSTREASGGWDTPVVEEVDEIVELKDNMCGPIPDGDSERKSSESVHTSFCHNDCAS